MSAALDDWVLLAVRSSESDEESGSDAGDSDGDDDDDDGDGSSINDGAEWSQ